MKTCKASYDLTFLLLLPCSLRWLRSPCPPCRSSNIPGIFPLQCHCTRSSSAQIWCPFVSMWLFLTSLLTGHLIREPSLTSPYHHHHHHHHHYHHHHYHITITIPIIITITISFTITIITITVTINISIAITTIITITITTIITITFALL